MPCRFLWIIVSFVICATAIVLQVNDSICTAETTGSPVLQTSIMINHSTRYQDDQRPPVSFPHSHHTEALGDSNKTTTQETCKLCHNQYTPTLVKTLKGLDLQFKNTGEKSNQMLMDAFHAGCIDCHKKTAETGNTAVPFECASCHKKTNTTEKTALVKNDYSKNIHKIHTKSMKNDCSYCHHEKGKTPDTVTYTKNKEGSCQYCHADTSKTEVMKEPIATHTLCIACHISTSETLADNNKKEPVSCIQCHGKDSKLFLPLPEDDTFRLDRGQKDIYFTGYKIKNDNKVNKGVFFNHKRHEKHSKSCKECHHSSLESCSDCHQKSGIKKGGFNSYENIAHNEQSPKSCKGCHNQTLEKRECSGCHGFNKKSHKKDLNCHVCHYSLTDENLMHSSQEDLIASYQQIQAENKTNPSPSDQVPDVSDAFPDKIMIKVLEDRFKPVMFPHKQIVSKLVENINGNTLAAAFHYKTKSICAGCHHNSLSGSDQVKCSTCHSVESGNGYRGKPALNGAYHIQCMECHERMNIELAGGTKCFGCHQEK